jgi:hypothetical protein
MEAFRRRYGLDKGPPAAAPAAVPDPAAPTTAADGGPAAQPQFGTNGVVTVMFRAVSLREATGQPEANKETAYAVLSEIRNSPLFDPAGTRFDRDIGADEPPGTFTFSITAKLKKPLKL